MFNEKVNAMPIYFIRHPKVFYTLISFILISLPRDSTALTCSISNISALNFGTIMPLTNNTATTSLTFNYSCTKAITDVLVGATLCLNIGASSISGQVTSRQMSALGLSSPLSYQLYQNANGSLIWGSQYASGGTPIMISVSLSQGVIPVTGSVTIYAQLSANQSNIIPGIYLDTYTTLTASTTINLGVFSTPTTCGTIVGPTFPFTVNAIVEKQCIVSSNGDINLGNTINSVTNANGNSSISITCTNTTPFTIGLSPSNNNSLGAGVLKSTTSTDQIPYQLSSNPSGSVWGNNSPNVISDTGSGVAKPYTVYATVPSANFTLGNYNDTVTVNVLY